MFSDCSFDPNSEHCKGVGIASCDDGVNGGCEHYCLPQPDDRSIKCLCREGFLLQSDEKSCKGQPKWILVSIFSHLIFKTLTSVQPCKTQAPNYATSSVLIQMVLMSALAPLATCSPLTDEVVKVRSCRLVEPIFFDDIQMLMNA